MQSAVASRPVSQGRLKFLIGGLLIVAAIGYLIFSATSANSQYFLTVEELQSRGQTLAGKDVRVSGAVIGSTIQYDPQSLTLMFSVAQVPGDNSTVDAQGGLAAVLHAAVIDPSKPRLKVVYHGPRPDLLKDEAQAIMTGQLGSDGVFQANELLLKCPTRYQDAVPNQVQK
ncbi:MAG: cytochrome c maturation protein CcmE [Anaerolineaceae bacterium]